MPPRLARLLAAVVAIALVAGAFALRGALSDDEDTTSGPEATADGDGYRLLCDEDLGEAACTAVADLSGVAHVEVLSWAQVEERYTETTPPFDAWLTLDPMPAVLDEAREIAGQPAAAAGGQEQVASSGLSLLSLDGALGCDEVGWDCLVEAAGSQDIGVPGVDSSAGVVVASSALLAMIPEVDVEGFDDRTDVLSALEDLVANSGEMQEQPTTFVTQRGRFDGVVTASALAERRAQARATEGVVATRLSPAVSIGVVLAGLGSQGEEAVAALTPGVREQTVVEALGAGGWSGPAAATSTLPEADLIYALQEDLGS